MPYLEFQEVPQPLEKRIETAREGKNLWLDPNCYSTAFFLFGILPYEVVIFTSNSNERVKDALSKMTKSEKIQDKSLMISSNREKEIIHASFILEASPLEGFHRTGARSSFRKFKSFEEVEDYLREFYEGIFTHKFYSVENGVLEGWARKRVEEYSPGWDA